MVSSEVAPYAKSGGLGDVVGALPRALVKQGHEVAVVIQNHELTIEMKKNGAPIQKTMYGLFIEDINYAADGGLYAELVKNRSFDFPYAFTGWQVAGNVEVRNNRPLLWIFFTR